MSTRFKIQHTPFHGLGFFAPFLMYDSTTLMTDIPTTRRKLEATTILRTICTRLEAEAYDDFDMARPNQTICVADYSTTTTLIPGLDFSRGHCRASGLTRKSMSSQRQMTMSGMLWVKGEKDTGCQKTVETKALELPSQGVQAGSSSGGGGSSSTYKSRA